MDLSTLDGAIQFSIANGYLIMFLIMIFEGPIITTAASFAASLGYFNILTIFLLGFLGNVVGDTLMYAVGHFTRKKVLNKYTSLFKIKKVWIKNTEKHFGNHLGKILFFVKLTPLAVPGLILAGASRVNFKRYTLWCALVDIPEVLFFAILGYSFGVLAGIVLTYFKAAQFVLMALVIALFLAYFIGKKISESINKKRDSF